MIQHFRGTLLSALVSVLLMSFARLPHTSLMAPTHYRGQVDAPVDIVTDPVPRTQGERV